ncbi:NAD(P)-binding domain-containing protein [Gordonia sp. PKS22-38]|uniref:NAD(P)-binding domain-containing protein n=1 Tax=Gordonia prachuapensis TaxID=3115651 RepID=A0ABU7N0G0_9ACTN|nr:NAD(P)-binding domain-containing protein [Gordonia sp. PKS22-38]
MTTSTPAQLDQTALIGLGPMGTALAGAMLAASVPLTVWNRTRAKAEPLADDGAAVGDDLKTVVREARLVITCLRDHQSTRDLLQTIPASAFADTTVVVLASSTPDDARETARWAEQQGIDVLPGAIMVPTPVIGTPGALVLYSGPRHLVDRHRAVLQTFAPRSEYVGDDPGLASTFDTAMLEIFFTAMTAFLHAAAMVTATGTSATDFVPKAKEMLDILPATFEGLAADVDAGQHPGIEDSIAMEAAALGHIVAATRDAGLDERLPALMYDLASTAVAREHGDDSWSRIVDLLRRPAGTPTTTALAG